MNTKFTVSVIITTFNRKTKVKQALDSVLRQSHKADEIILVDDGSGDGTQDSIIKDYPQIRYTWQENKGISQARNRGIRLASSNWLAFLDSDDTWLDNKLEKQISALKEDPEYKICYSNELWIRHGKRVNQRLVHQKYGGDIFRHCLPLCIISPSSVLINRSLFKKIGYFDRDLPACEDYDLWLRICAFFPVLYLNVPLIVKYGGHEDQLSKKYWGMDRFRIYALEKIINNNQISIDKRISAVEVILHKINIYLQGAHKRNKQDEINLYLNKKKNYTVLLSECINTMQKSSNNSFI
jgi:glycosyltransferase involved in cell wall biosynthesis